MDFLDLPWLLFLIVFMALVFDYINGFHDAANAIATVVSTKVLSPKVAVIFGALLNFGGALLGTQVAATIGKGLVDDSQVSLETVFCALVGAILWNLFTWWKGLPTSSSHALIGSLLGATFFSRVGQFSGDLIHWEKFFEKVLIPMFTSPLVGFLVGYLVMSILTFIVYRMSLQTINGVFGKFQILSAAVMALSHGNNDAQKSMGIIALAMMTVYPKAEFSIDLWIILSCALAMGLGTLSGGWRIIRTMGSKMIKLQPVHGFAAETTAASIIMVASHWGIPLSTTHVISTSIMGVGAAKRFSALKLNVALEIVTAWVLTLPITFLVAGLLSFLMVTIQSWL